MAQRNFSNNVRRVIKPRMGMFKITGTLAALVKESVWALMLKGEPVGVWEPDQQYWSLIHDGHVVDTMRADRAEDAVRKFSGMYRGFRAWADDLIAGKQGTGNWALRAGYPNVLFLLPANIEQHKRDGMDDRKLSLRMRELLKQAATMDVIQEQLKFGTRREGKE